MAENENQPEGNVEVPVQDKDPREPAPQQSQQAQQQPMAEAKCMQCQAVIYLRLPIMRVVNTPEASLVFLPHEKPQTCQKCGKGYVPIIRGVVNGQLDIQFAPVEVQQPSLIVPANQQAVSAVEQSRVRSKSLVIPN